MRISRGRRPGPVQDRLPESLSVDSEAAGVAQMPLGRRIRLIVRDTLTTPPNKFSLYRLYKHRPTHEPDAFLKLKDLAVTSHHIPAHDPPSHLPVPPSDTPTSPAPSPAKSPAPWPFANMSIWRFMSWINNGNTTKSATEVNDLAHNVLLSPDFNVAELAGFNCETENTRFERQANKTNDPLAKSFMKSDVNFTVPSSLPGVKNESYSVKGLYHRKLTDIIRGAFQESLADHMHFSPFALFHRPPNSEKAERVYGELYTSDTFIEEHDKVTLSTTNIPSDAPPDERNLEKVVAAIMFFSDATHLASFGNAKAWPIYLGLGNLSKYIRARPSSGSLFHAAYVPSVCYLSSTIR